MTTKLTTSFSQEDIINSRKLIRQISSELINARVLYRSKENRQQMNPYPFGRRLKKKGMSRDIHCNESSKEAKCSLRKMMFSRNTSVINTQGDARDKMKLSYVFSHINLDPNLSSVLNTKMNAEENNYNNDYTFEKQNTRSNKGYNNSMTCSNSNVRLKRYNNMSQRNIQSRQIGLDCSNDVLMTYNANGIRKTPIYRSFMVNITQSNSRSKILSELNENIPYGKRNNDKTPMYSSCTTIDAQKINNSCVTINTISIGNNNRRASSHFATKAPLFQKKIVAVDYYTHVGYSGPKVVKENQDFYSIETNYLRDYYANESFFLAVYDGHGTNGHLASRHIASLLPYDLKSFLNQSNNFANTYERDNIITNVFLSANKNLVNSNIKTTQSGTTCCSLIVTPTTIISANLGDSRAIVGRFANDKWTAVNLTRDQKPEDPREKPRIIERGGRVEAILDSNGKPGGPMRIWKAEEDVPGLAMARSFGDTIAAECGAISEPEIKEYRLSAFDKFIIVASDGVWEWISSLECVQMMSQFYLNNDLKGGLEYLYTEADRRWKIDYDEAIDDITIVMAFLE